MSERLTLSRYKLTTFLTCQRQFQLRYLDRLPWPVQPVSERSQTAVSRGHAFHQLLQQYFLDIAITPAAIDDPLLRNWWTTFANNKPPMPNGERKPEIGLTVPVGKHLLNGRFDLIILSETADGQPSAHIFDWKTGTPQEESTLRHDWQTRLYLSMLVEGGHALWTGKPDATKLLPEHVSITYWYVQAPDEPQIIRYDAAAHAQNWADITELVNQIETQIALDDWPLTDDLTQCRTCPFQTYCGREDAGVETKPITEDTDIPEFDSPLEPNLP